MSEPESVPRTRAYVLAVATLAHAMLYAALRRRSIEWDGLAFLHKEPQERLADFAHWFYPWALHLSRTLGSVVGVAGEESGKLFSAASASATFLSLWILAERAGARAVAAAAAALLVTTAPLYWEQAATVEAYAPALACLTAAAVAAQRFALRPSAPVFFAAFVAWFLATSLHFCAALGGLWLIALADPRSIRRRDFVLPAIFVVAVATAAWKLNVRPSDVGGFVGFASGFVYRSGIHSSPLDALRSHFVNTWQFYGEETPILTACGIAGSFVAAWQLRRVRPGDRTLVAAAALALPYWIAYWILGVPVLGFLIPALPALGLAAAAGTAALRGHPRVRLAATLLLGAGALAQLALALPARVHDSRTPDPLRTDAEALAGALPRDAVIFAGLLARHIKHYTTTDVVLLPEVLHKLRSQGADSAVYSAYVRREAARQARAGRIPVIDTSGGRLLSDLGLTPQQIRALIIEAEQIQLRVEPPLVLYRLRTDE